MDAATIGLIGIIIGTAISSWVSIYRDRNQRREERQIEHSRWTRDQAQQIYSNCIDYLSRLSHSAPESSDATVDYQKEYLKNFNEAQKWLGLLLVYHPVHDKQYNTLQKYILDFSAKQKPDAEMAGSLRKFVIQLASNDSGLFLKQK